MRCRACHRRLPARPGAACPAHPLEDQASGRAEEAPEAEPAPSIAGFRVEGRIGQGGFAHVHAAAREGDGLAAAIKVARRAGEPRLEREAAALARLAPPFVPALLGRGRTDDGRPFLALERLWGSSLAEWLAELPGSGAAPRARAVEIVSGLATAIDAAHDAGVVHRDIKPENVWLRRDGSVALIDFGLAAGGEGAALGPDLTRTGDILGTPAYMAPEQCLGAGEVGAPADVYALGAVIFELLTGRPPFMGAAAAVRQAHAARRPDRPSSLAALPEAVDALVLRCLAKDPADRPRRAGEVARALAAALSAGAPPEAAAVQAPAPSQPAAPAARREVALLALRTRAAADVLAEAVRAEGGVVARFRGERTVLAFPAAAAPGPGVRAALRAARRLVAAGEVDPPVMVHVAPLRVREGARGMTLAGAALEAPEAWGQGDERASASPASSPRTGPRAAPSWGGYAGTGPAVLTAEAQRALADDPDEEGDAPPPEPGDAPIRGRDEAIAAALGAAREGLAGGGPALCALLGPAGHGKSRMIAALAEALRREEVAVHVLAAPRPEEGERGAALAALLRAALGLPAGGPVPVDEAAVRAALAQRLGEGEGEAAWPAVGLALGLLSDRDPAAQALLAAPGALRLAQARALAAALAAASPLALLLDDADRADAAALDAIELATAEGREARLAILIAAQPSILSLHPRLGDRAARRLTLELGPLDAEAAGALLLDRLRPVEFVPRPVLDHLHALTRGVPLDLAEVAHALRVGGAIRRARGGEGWALAPDELLHLSATPHAERLAERALAALTPPLVDLVERAAVLGDDLSPAAFEALERAGGGPPGSDVSVDPGVGLARLARAGVLVAHPADPRRCSFRHPLLREAVEARIPPARRRALHAAVLRHLEASPHAAGARARIARHAAAAGELATAARAHAELAEEALLRHDVVEAEQRFTAALRLLEGGDASSRERALAGRGRARYRLQRIDEALADLRAARALAEARGDRARTAEMLLEEATALDWQQDYGSSAAAAARAAELCAGLGDAWLSARCLLAGGRSLCRSERMDEAIPSFEEAARRALALGDHEGHVIARLLLVGCLSVTGRIEEAERHSEAVIEACLRAGDAFHLCSAYLNRLFMWVKRHADDRALADQREAIRLARDLGHAQLERWATFNLSELRYWMGAHEEALTLARRCLDLRRRFVRDHPPPDDALLLARIQLARGDHEDAARHLAEVREGYAEADLAPCARTLARLVQQALDEQATGRFDAEAWRALVEEARETALLHEHMEALHGAALSALRVGASREALAFLGEADAIAIGFWRQRFDEIREAIPRP